MTYSYCAGGNECEQLPFRTEGPAVVPPTEVFPMNSPEIFLLAKPLNWLRMLLRLWDYLRHLGRLRTWTAEHATGRRGEDLAHRYLQGLGYIVVARNYRLSSGSGEADIIAWDGDELVIVEVKTRESEEFGPPERAIDGEKRLALNRVARDYARKSNTANAKVRCDAVSVILTAPPRIELFRNAVRWKFTA